VGLLAYSPLAGGALSGKYISSNPTNARFNLFPGYMERYNKSQAKAAVAEYVAVAQKHGLTASELALAWCSSRWAPRGAAVRWRCPAQGRCRGQACAQRRPPLARLVRGVHHHRR
jgi:aryl-alcohol dehydrogenase-like predicted oxidoreductase